MRKIVIFSAVVWTLLVSLQSSASHIRAGEIIARRVSSDGKRWAFTFFGYRDVEGVLFGQTGVFDFGDGNKWGDNDNETFNWENITDLGNGVEQWEFTLVYTYAANSGTYLVSYKEEFRNENIQNISGSSTTTFYVETKIILDPLVPNNSPFFDSPPIDQGVVGAVFEHNPAAVDPDGDSLAYFFVTPKSALNQPVDGYKVLNHPSFYEVFSEGNADRNGEPTLTIDDKGTISWDAPGGKTIPPLECREFNVAFVVEEYRKLNGIWIKLGFVMRDMQIIICDYENEPPEIEVPPDTCIVAGEVLKGRATATDPEGRPIKMEAFGAPFEVSPAATFDPNPPTFQESPASLSLEWATSCNLVRESPYEFVIKATDDPQVDGVPNPPGQVNFEVWNVKVIGPPPQGLVAEKVDGDRSIDLSWDPYQCFNADSMEIWRRVGEFDFDYTCETGVPANAGYERIKTVDIATTSFTDENGGLGLAPGSKYCYRLVATFPAPLGGESLASEEACDSLLIDVPVITNVDIKRTSETNGEILVTWVPPIQIDTTDFEPPFTYELRRSENGFEGPFENFEIGLDTFFVDSGLNTKDQTYTYQINFFDANNLEQPIGSSQFASSVRLTPRPEVGGIRLEWTADVPWSNRIQRFPYHLIYRDNVSNDPSELILIDSVNVTTSGFTFFDDGGFNDQELDEEIDYCYYVTTRGSYDNELLPEPLINSSQIICAQPNDTISPCPPVAVMFDANLSCESQLSSVPCGINDFENAFSWNMDMDSECENDILNFRIYYSESGEEGSYRLLDETSALRYVHGGLSSLAGCYFITSMDRSGNESDRSEVFCNDNCPQYGLPNVITPNGDGKNDEFRPLESVEGCPRFVKSVKFTVVNRAGVVLFQMDSNDPEQSININWDGTTDTGQELPPGVYFFSAEVEYIRLNPEDNTEVINGWVQVIR